MPYSSLPLSCFLLNTYPHTYTQKHTRCSVIPACRGQATTTYNGPGFPFIFLFFPLPSSLSCSLSLYSCCLCLLFWEGRSICRNYTSVPGKIIPWQVSRDVFTTLFGSTSVFRVPATICLWNGMWSPCCRLIYGRGD